MSETPLQKLLRLRKEKEQSNDSASSSNSETQLETPALETVSGQGSSSSSSTGTEGSGVSSSEGGVALPEETTSEDSNILVDSGSSADSSASLEPAEVVPEAKPMSAMDRLRALKSGGVKKDAGNPSLGNSNPTSDSAKLVDDLQDKVVTPPKPRKTHPIAMEMAELEAALDAHVPGFVSILSTVHKKLKADPDVVTLLDDEEIAKIVAGLEKHTNVTIVAPSAVKAAKSKAKKEPVSAMDL